MKRSLILLGVLAFAAICALAPCHAEAVEPGSQPIGCDQADQPITLTQSSHLDPSCTYTRGIEITASNVTLDCQEAHIAAPDRRYGIYIHAPQSVALSNITVRNCHVEGFLNNIHIEHEGFRDYTVENEYDNAFSNIVIEDSTSLNSRGVGIFVNGYVSGVTLRNLHVEGASSTGIYLEHGSKGNVVENSDIVNNGFGENGPSGQFFEFGGATFWFWGTGREGVAIDGSRFNEVKNNRFSGNAAGGIFLYKNCGEFVNQRPQRWWHRRYGADGNTIENNTFTGGENGIWIGARQSENTLPMDCSDPAIFNNGLTRVVLDYAKDNTVRGNTFDGVQWGVRVEDDGSVVEDNQFSGSDPAQQAILVGTRYRTTAIAEPVDDTTISGNRSTIAGNPDPYRWIWGHTNTAFSDNQSLGRAVGFCEGVQPRQNALIFVLAFVPADPNAPPPSGGPPTFPPPAPLPPCPIACESGATVAKGSIAIRRLGSPPGDDTLLFKGELTLPQPSAPPIDPVATGIGVLITDSSDARLLDVTIPGGAYDRVARSGWTASSNGLWRYRSRSAGITSITIKDLSTKRPGVVQFAVRGAKTSFVVDPAKLPLTGLLSLDPPSAATGQCALAAFPGPQQSCTSNRGAVVCR